MTGSNHGGKLVLVWLFFVVIFSIDYATCYTLLLKELPIHQGIFCKIFEVSCL
jgi:hypothetical protein